MTSERIAELRVLAEKSGDFSEDTYIDIGSHDKDDMAFLTVARGAMLEALDALERVRTFAQNELAETTYDRDSDMYKSALEDVLVMIDGGPKAAARLADQAIGSQSDNA